ncbi:hypothetical protein AK88_01765 [Plasmodium fragile]|uniref:Serine aminopeptidase S33 domain-containing protein n=1 Tax=Plasmodium fragile TaxID=5857 RepID=A0A0D9QS25_PLAFR|nr:uncharacterized protein AK88_01765 [Plasmodium fragile]KJP88486.1 hypothetical protein AK88_01765 [Plasmodium fragile]
MISSSKIAYEYVTCTKGRTFIVYSKNLPSKESTTCNSSSCSLQRDSNSASNHEKAIVLLLHGLNGGTHQYEKLMNSLVYVNHAFISLDFYGHGNSVLSKNLNKFTERLYTEQIYDVLRNKNILDATFIIVAFSMGCIIATHLSSENKIHIKKFCLISAAGLAKPRHRFLIFLLKYNIRICLRLAKKYSHLMISEDAVKNEYYNFENNVEDAMKRYSILRENHEKFIETFLKVLTGTNVQNSKKQYAALFKTNVDILFIYGKEDKLTPYTYTVKFLEKKKKYTQNVKMIVLPECCHLVIHEKYAELVQLLLQFLQ